DVVPPAAARRRVALVPPEEPIRVGRDRHRRRLHLPPRRCARGNGHPRRVDAAREAGLAGAVTRIDLRSDTVSTPTAEMRRAIEGVAHHLPQPSTLVIENTYMALSGAPISVAEMATLCGIAHAGGLRVHVDGARIWNAAVALGVAPRDLVAPADTVMFCLSKG